MKTQLLTIGALALSLLTASAQEIATWAGWKKAAVTYTFDDAPNEWQSHNWAATEMNKYGFPGTFYIVTNWGNFSNYQTLASKGHEIGSHTVSHSGNSSELASSQNAINSTISGQKCITIAYPNCNVIANTLQYYIGGRICGGQTNSKSPNDFSRLDSYICGNQGKNSTSAITQIFQGAAGSGGWAVLLIHGIQGMQANGSYSPLAQDAFKGSLDFLNQNKSTYWVATFRDAILYIKERNAASFKKTAESDSEVSYTLTDNLDDNTYNYPLSVKVPVPDGWSDFIVTQNEEEIEFSISGDEVYFEAVPDGGTISLVSAGAIVPDPTFTITVPDGDWCKDSSYTVNWAMSGEAKDEYSLFWEVAGASDAISVSSVSASSEWTNEEGNFSWAVDNILTDDGAHGENSRWGAQTNENEYVVLNLSKTQTVGGVEIDEFTEYGTVSSFEIQVDEGGSWKTVYEGTEIGENFKASFAPVSTSKVRFFIKAASGININYVYVTGLSSMLLSENIKANGSYKFTPTIASAGILSIKKPSGKTLGSSGNIVIANCGGSTEEPGSAGSGSGSAGGADNECYTGGGYTGPSCDGEGSGAYFTGVYRNLFSEYLGKTQEEVDAKIESLWNHFFGGQNNKTVYYTVGSDMAYILDTGNNDVRTEGMSYGMMICVQLDKKEEFDKLWRWAKKYMQYKSGDQREGLFAWQLTTDGSVKGSSCAPDGEAYFITALFFASHRWGNDGEIDYGAEAQYILKEILDKPGRQNGTVSPIFNLDSYLINFGETSYGFTDPSYNLPGFLELWARWTDTNKDFWSKTAKASRDLLYKSSHSTTGLFPDYSQFDGTPYKPDWCGYESDYYKYDAIRCPMNVGMDYHWFGTDERQKDMMSRILNFFKKDGYQHGYFQVNGSNPSGGYSEGMAGANGVGVFALEDEALAKEYINKMWSTPAPTGQYRYYNGMVYMLSFLHASGNFKIWKPEIEVNDVVKEGKSSVEYNGKTYTESTTFCEFVDCEYNNVSIIIDEESTGISDAADNNASDFCYFDKETGVISVKSADVIENVTLCDLNGRLLLSEDGSEVEASALSDGIYIVRVQTVSGNVQYCKVSISK